MAGFQYGSLMLQGGEVVVDRVWWSFHGGYTALEYWPDSDVWGLGQGMEAWIKGFHTRLGLD